MKKFFIFSILICVTSCAHTKKLMKNCDHIKDSVYQCEEI